MSKPQKPRQNRKRWYEPLIWRLMLPTIQMVLTEIADDYAAQPHRVHRGADVAENLRSHSTALEWMVKDLEQVR